MASRRIARTKSFSAYLSSINDEVANLKSRADTTGQAIEGGAVSGGSLADELSLVSNGISSSNYIPNYLGWRISGSGVAEFSDVFVRGDINAYSGTIGYWNISSPSVTRVFGDTSLYGTFLESSAIGDSDAGKTDGSYVGLFKSYTLEPNPILFKYRRDNIATITTPGHAFLVGDLVYVDVTGDTSFSALSAPVAIIEATGDTISYINEGVDFTNLDASNDPLDNTASGNVTLYNPDVAGLYLRDYSKKEFDYGYFSNTGVAYVSAEDVNVIENPSFENINSSGSLVSSTTSWGLQPTSGSLLTLAIEDFTASAKPFKSTTTYGAKLTWGNTVTSYISSTIDYAAGNQYGVFGLGRNIYFGVNVFPTYTPVDRTISAIETYNLTASFTSATANATTVTYTGSGLPFSAGQYITVTGFSNSRYNLVDERIATANATTVTFAIAGTTEATETSTRTASSGLLKVTTTSSHGFGAGATVFIDVDAGYDLGGFGEVTQFYAPRPLEDGSSGYTYTISASPAPSGSVLYASTSFGIIAANATSLTLTSHVNVDGTTTRDNKIFGVNQFALDLSSIRLRYSNAATTNAIDVVSSSTNALWSAGTNKYMYVSANSYMLGYLDPDVKIPSLLVPDAVIFDGASIDAAYLAADPTGYAAESDIYLDIPGWLVSHDGAGVVPSTPVKISNVGYVLDNAHLSTSTNFFYGSDLSTNRWFATTEDATSYDPAQASVEAAKSWMNIDLENQSAYLDYFDQIGFRNNTFSKTMAARPSLGVYGSSSDYFVFPDSDYETTTLSGGEYQYSTSANTYVNVSSSLKLTTGDRSSSFELSAARQNLDEFGGVDFNYGAVIAGVYDDRFSNGVNIYTASNRFSWAPYSQYLTNPAFESIVFTEDLASFSQRIRTDGSVSAGAAIYTSSGNIRTNLGNVYTTSGNIYTTSGDIYTSNGSFTGNTISLTSTAPYSLITTDHPFQIGLTASDNLRMDRDGIQAVSNGAVSALNVNTFGGTVTVGNSTSTLTVVGYLRVDSTNDVSLGSTNHPFQIGPTGGINLRLDSNEIQGVNNGASNTINIQASGGNTVIGAGGGDLIVGNSTSTGNLILGSTAGSPQTEFFYKWGYSSAIGTSRALSIASTGLVGYATSTRDSKQDIEDLLVDVSSVLSVVPKKFKYKVDTAQFGSAAEMSYGFIAEDLDDLGLSPFVDYDEFGKPFGIDYPKYVVALQAVVKHQASQIQSLSDRLDALEDN